MHTLLQDLRFAFRQLLKNPGFTAVAVLTLAFGIGANTAIFSIIDAVLLKNLPVKDPEQLVAMDASFDAAGRQRISFSYPAFEALRERNQVFSGAFAYSGVSLNFSANAQTERVSGKLVSGNFFSVLGVEPYLGRFFSDEGDRTPGATPEAILSYNFWTGRFASDPTAIGKTIQLNGYPFTIAGILPAGFFGVEVGSAPEIWIPMAMQAQLFPGSDRLRQWGTFWVNTVGRLKPGVSEQEAQAATEILSQQIYQEAPGRLRNFSKIRVQLHPASKGLSSLREQFKQPLLILMAVVGLVLLIACANVANLLLARGTARQTEIAVRLALGASRGRLVRQLLTESTLLSLLGAVFGLVLAFWTNGFLLRFLSQTGSALELHPDFRVLSFNVGVAVLTGLLFGLAPAFQATRPNLTAALKSEPPTLARGGRRFELRKILVVAQVAVALVLLIGAGLFVRTLQNLKEVDLGFRADKVLLLSMNPGLSGYRSNQVVSFYAQLLDRVQSLPGVQSVSVADMPLLGGAYIDGISV